MKKIIIKESFDPGLKYSLYSNFRNWEEAILELLDNAVSNRIMGKRLSVDIFTSPKFIQIINRGGKGMGEKQLKEFFQWGKIKKREAHDLGAYSQGGKAAMGYLGKSMTVKASPDGSKVLYKIEDDNLHDMKLKRHEVEQMDFENPDGYVDIQVNKLKRKIKNNDLSTLIVDRYKPLIDNYQIEVKINGEQLKSQAFPLDENFHIEKFSFDLKFGNQNYPKVKGWIGRLAPRSGLRGGMRCYKLGRLITDQEYFGHPDSRNKQTLNSLFGEVYLNHVPATTNKTGFDRNSDQWEEVERLMFDALKPHIKELLSKETQEPTDEDKEKAKNVKELLAELMRMKNKELDGKALVEQPDQGQKPGVHSVGAVEIKKENEKSSRTNSPRTAPPKDAEGKRLRLKGFMDCEPRNMSENIRSIIEEKDGKKTLVVNNVFAGYKAAAGSILYYLETAAMQLAKPDGDEQITTEEYVQSFDELYSFFCNNKDLAKDCLNQKKKEKVAV